MSILAVRIALIQPSRNKQGDFHRQLRRMAYRPASSRWDLMYSTDK